MAQLGTRTDGRPYQRRLSKRTRRVRVWNEPVVALDLVALERAPNLRILEISRTPLRALDLRPLTRCAQLEQLAIEAAEPIDLAPLADCPTLQSLHVYCHTWPRLDLAPLAGHPQLRGLSLNGGAFETLDLSPLSHCAALRRFHLESPAVQHLDLAPLGQDTQMQHFSVGKSGVQRLDLTPCRGWTRLETLHLMNSPVHALDLRPLRDTALRNINLAGLSLERLDLTPLAGLETLTDLLLHPLPPLYLGAPYVTQPEQIASPAIQTYAAHARPAPYDRPAAVATLLAHPPQGRPDFADAYTPIEEETFWRLIEDAGHAAATTGTDQALEIARRLLTLSDRDLGAFSKIYWQMMGRLGHDVHRIVYQVHGGCSDDTFMDFREWLIAQGKTTFYQVQQNPQVLHEWGEGFIDTDEGVIWTPLYAIMKKRGIKA